MRLFPSYRSGRRPLTPRHLLASLFLLGALSAGTAARALTFNLTDGTELASLQTTNLALYNQVRGGFDSAAALWAAQLTNNVTVNITINYRSLGSGVLASAGSSSIPTAYSTFRNQLITGANTTSTVDQTVVANLPATTPTYTVRNSGATINASSINATTANLKALGIMGASNMSDAAITFSSNFAFDFDRSNGIDSNQYDFIGVAAHEIGHSLGFTSVVNQIDNLTAGNTGNFTPTPMDFFRFSSAATRDLSADNVAKYFSVNLGNTDANGGAFDLVFSTGVRNGDGNQASHWKDGLGIGIMDPTAGNGELIGISANDLAVLDAIGWNLASGTSAIGLVPEPHSLSFLILCAISVAAFRFRHGHGPVPRRKCTR